MEELVKICNICLEGFAAVSWEEIWKKGPIERTVKRRSCRGDDISVLPEKIQNIVEPHWR